MRLYWIEFNSFYKILFTGSVRINLIYFKLMFLKKIVHANRYRKFNSLHWFVFFKLFTSKNKQCKRRKAADSQQKACPAFVLPCVTHRFQWASETVNNVFFITKHGTPGFKQPPKQSGQSSKAHVFILTFHIILCRYFVDSLRKRTGSFKCVCIRGWGWV